jgi:uncharacterized repeat protein (TIGR01451 family)
MRLRVLRWPLLVALALAPLVLAPPARAHTVSFPQFERCLKDNGLTDVPAQQASSPVQVCKTVKVTRVTVYAWSLTIDPTSASAQIPLGQSPRVPYQLATPATPTVYWIVDGRVVVRNVGLTDVTITGVRDTLSPPAGTPLTQAIGPSSFTLMSPESKDCVEPPEKVIRYSFTVPGPQVPSLPSSGANAATVTWTATGAPVQSPHESRPPAGATPAAATTATTIPVVFAEGPDLNEVIYFRKATLTHAFDLAPPGLLVGPPDNPGPFPLAADDPATLLHQLSVAVTNQSLTCGSSATLTGVGYVQSPSVPELVGDPSLPPLPPLPVNVSSRSLLLVTTPPCAAAAEKPPGATGAGVPAPPGRAAAAPPAKPARPSAPVCPRPILSASLAGPSRTLANGRASWLIVVRNRGRAAARRVVVRERVPDGFAFVGASRAVSAQGRMLTFSPARLPSGGTLAIRLRLQAGAVVGGSHQRLSVSANCGAVAQARAPVSVTPAIAPAVTG